MKTKYMISEGVKYKNSTFTFDFKYDDKTDIIALTDNLFSSVSYDNTYFYQYEFGSDVSSKLRSEFIHALKFDQNVLGLDNINRFIDRAMTNLNKVINLSTVDIVIYPQSSSSLTRDIVNRIDSFTDSEKYIKLELAKKQISEIGFNWSKFDKYCDVKEIPDNIKDVMKKKMDKMLNDIHVLDYFSIAKHIKDQKYKKFLSTIYKFYDAQTIELIKSIKDKKILIIDDIYTSGVTIEQIIKAYQMLTPDDSNTLTIFTLIGKKRDA